MSTEDGAPGVGSRWRAPRLLAVITVTDVTPSMPSGTMLVSYTLDRGEMGTLTCVLDDWKSWVASGRATPVKEEEANGG